MSPAKILGIETTCDETAAAVFTDEPKVLSNVVSSQIAIHRRYGGVVPEIASRAHVPQLLPIIDQALSDAKITLEDLDAIAVTYTPGLIGAILVGLTTAKTLALALGVPLLGVNHLEGHIYACQMVHDRPIFPCVGFVVSGGHSNLFACQSSMDFQPLGSTIDDAAGEAFDKVSALLGLGYPGGPAIAKAAEKGDPKAYKLPRSFYHEDRLDFSFSGVKTAVLYTFRGPNAVKEARPLTEQEVCDMAASFQQAVVDVLVRKALQAVEQTGLGRLCVGGGVAANQLLRSTLEEACQAKGIELVLPPLSWCTDNAAMQAVAIEKYRSGRFDSLDLDAVAGLVRFPQKQ